MAYPQFKIIKLNDLQEYDNYNIYDEYIKATDPVFYSNLDNPQLTELGDDGTRVIESRMENAVRFFASKGIGELTQIMSNFNKVREIGNGIKKYFGNDYDAMNDALRTTLANHGSTLDFTQILQLYERLQVNSDVNKYIYNTLSAITKTTPSSKKFYVFRCYKRLFVGKPLLDIDGRRLDTIYLDQLISTSILLRVCDFWCTPSPINVDNTTNPAALNIGDNSIICIEIPAYTHGISLINYAGIISNQLTTTYSEFEYLLPPGGTLKLTTETYRNYTSITREQLKARVRVDPLIDPYPDFPTTFDIPIYRYNSVVPDNRKFRDIVSGIYKYQLPHVRNILVRNMIYVGDQLNDLRGRVVSSISSIRRRRSGYVPFNDDAVAQGRRLRKHSIKHSIKHRRKHRRKHSRKHRRPKRAYKMSYNKNIL